MQAVLLIWIPAASARPAFSLCLLHTLFMHRLCALIVERHKVLRKQYPPSSQDTCSLTNGTGLELGAFGGLGVSPASFSPLPPLQMNDVAKMPPHSHSLGCPFILTKMWVWLLACAARGSSVISWKSPCCYYGKKEMDDRCFCRFPGMAFISWLCKMRYSN